VAVVVLVEQGGMGLLLVSLAPAGQEWPVRLPEHHNTMPVAVAVAAIMVQVWAEAVWAVSGQTHPAELWQMVAMQHPIPDQVAVAVPRVIPREQPVAATARLE
jgi:hypothetical protein